MNNDQEVKANGNGVQNVNNINGNLIDSTYDGFMFTNSQNQLVSSMNLSQNEQKVKEKSMFQSTAGGIISCLGSAVGTGNIWRFPRIIATNSNSKGCLTFYLVWIFTLITWSIPVVVVECSIGRFIKNSVALAFPKFFGKKLFFLGGWMIGIVFFLGAYYPVVVGWCFYYLFLSCTLSSLPQTEEESKKIFFEFTEDSHWPVLMQFLVVFLSGLCLAGGIKYIEKANLVLVPLLLAIVIFSFFWSLTQQYANVAISYLFTPSWKTLKDPNLWISAAGQNAFDTNAGMAVLASYSTFMSRESKIVAYSIFIPLGNNIVSFYSSITLYSTVFSTMIKTKPTATVAEIIRYMKDAGPGSTGLTFIGFPVFLAQVGIFGRILCVLFFLCLSFAGISSLVSIIQVCVLVLKEFKVPHRFAIAICLFANLLFGLPSSLNLKFLENQDDTWGYGLIVSGFLFSILVIYYGPFRYRRVLINEFCPNDIKLPTIWIPLITIMVPIQFVVLVGWWIYGSIRLDPKWYELRLDSFLCTLLEWFMLIVILLIINAILYYTKILDNALDSAGGCDPYNPETYKLSNVICMTNVSFEVTNTNEDKSVYYSDL